MDKSKKGKFNCAKLKLMQPEQRFCPKCQFPILETYFFCPNCGKSLKLTPSATSAIKQIGIYSLSLFLPPLGLWPGIKYLKTEDSGAKMVGTIAIILTIISIVVTIWLTMGLLNNFNQYQNLGF
jgi:hypothetical protein